MGWIVGTMMLWGLKLIVNPFARLLAGDKVRAVVPAAPTPSGDAALPAKPGMTPKPAGAAKVEPEIPTEYYIIADVIVLGVAGLLLGLLTGSYFIGFSWRAKDWPGMVTFIIASLIGSLFY